MYIAYEISPSSRAAILFQMPPKFTKVICHHVTYKYPAKSSDTLPDTPKSAEVIGYALDYDGIEALVVEIEGTTERPDGGIFHITLSLNPEKKKPVDSNSLLKKDFLRIMPIYIKLEPKFLD